MILGKKWWKKPLKWLLIIGSVALFLELTDRKLTNNGWMAIILVSVALAAIRIYNSREAIKALLDQAGMLGAMHKMEKLEPKKIQVVEDVPRKKTIRPL